MAQYRKKPVVIEATQWNKDGDHPNVTEIPAKILDTIEARTAAIDINDCRWIAWHEWAEVQYKAGLLQKECGRCGKWKYPQEMSEKIDRHEAKSREGPVTVETAVCLKCMTPNAEVSGAGTASAGLPG